MSDKESIKYYSINPLETKGSSLSNQGKRKLFRSQALFQGIQFYDRLLTF